MDQKRIGEFISKTRKENNLTQQELAEKLGVSKNAVSKWERGICLMDMSLLKPLSEYLNVTVVDILSGELVSEDRLLEKYEESIENISKVNQAKSKSFGIYGLLIMFVILDVYKILNDIVFTDLLSMITMLISFKFIYKFKIEKDKINLIISIIAFIVSIFTFIMYIKSTI